MFNLLTAPSFGSKHLLGLLYVLIIVVLGVMFLKKDKKTLLYLAIAFYVLEILKLGYMVIQKGSFPMNHLPFHLCSIPLYVYPIIYFSKEGSHLNKFAKAAGYSTVLAAGITALVIPVNIIGSNDSWFPFTDNFSPLVSFTFHGLMIMTPIYMIKSLKYKLEVFDIVRAIVFTMGLMILALIANGVLDKDYMLLNYGNGSPLVFLLDYGQFVYTGSMILLGLIMISIFTSVTLLIQKLTKR